MISIVMDGNERGTDRAAALREYLLRHPDEYDFSFGDVEVDLVFAAYPTADITHELPPDRVYLPKHRAVELKMPTDFVQSLQSGHLADQRRNCPYPLQVAVLGSLGDVLRALAEVTRKGWRNPRERLQAEGMIRRGIASLKASGVDVSFGVGISDFFKPSEMYQYRSCRGARNDAVLKADAMALEANMAQVVREARAYLESDIHLPRAKCESVREAMLMCLPTVGPERAKGMLKRGIRPVLRTIISEPGGEWDCDTNAKDLIEVGKIGKKTAKKILEAVR